MTRALRRQARAFARREVQRRRRRLALACKQSEGARYTVVTLKLAVHVKRKLRRAAEAGAPLALLPVEVRALAACTLVRSAMAPEARLA